MEMAGHVDGSLSFGVWNFHVGTLPWACTRVLRASTPKNGKRSVDNRQNSNTVGPAASLR